MKLLEGVKADATMSVDGIYRYSLSRDWAGEQEKRRVLWIMLNPSTADACVDDPTIRRCQSFARSWGYNGITVANIFALRSTDPATLLTHPAPVGPKNDYVLRSLLVAPSTGLVVAAWGANVASLRFSRSAVALVAAEDAGRDVHCLGRTWSGQPRHPLYIPGDALPLLYRAAA